MRVKMREEELEYKYDFLNLVLMLLIITIFDYHIFHTNPVNQVVRNVTGLRFKSSISCSYEGTEGPHCLL